MRGITLRNYEREFRDGIDSESLNRNFREIYNDLSEAFLRYQYINTKLSQHVSDINLENQMLQARIEDLETDVAALGSDMDIVHWSAYSDDEIISNTGKQDVAVGNLTLGWSRSWTKMQITVNEWGDYEAGNATLVAFDPGTGTESYIDRPDDIYNAVDNNPRTNWVESYSSATPANVTVRIEIPPSINPSINTLYIAPFPDGGPKVTDIKYLTTAGTWVSLGTNIDHRTRLHFTPVDYNNQIKFTMTPVTLLDTESNSIDVFGMQDIEVGFIEYNNSSVTVVKLDSSNTITNITSVALSYTITPTVDEKISNPVILELFEDSGLTTSCYSSITNAHPYTGSIALATPSTSLYARITLKKINNTTPVVKELTIGIS